MTTFPKVTTVDTTYLRPGELIHMNFALYNVNFDRGFISIITVFCENTGTVWVFHTASKQSPVRTICYILTTLNN